MHMIYNSHIITYNNIYLYVCYASYIAHFLSNLSFKFNYSFTTELLGVFGSTSTILHYY